MFSNLEHAIVIAAVLWAAVKIFQHIYPSFWERTEAASWKSTFKFDERIKQIEEKLGITEEQK